MTRRVVKRKVYGFEFKMTPQSEVTLAKLMRADIRADLREALREATEPVVPAVRDAVNRTPSHTGRARMKQLRRAVAMAIKRAIKVTPNGIVVAILWVPRGGMSNFGRVLEGIIPWKHPTFGHEPDVDQESHPYFYPVIEKFAPAAAARVERVLDDFEKSV